VGSTIPPDQGSQRERESIARAKVAGNVRTIVEMRNNPGVLFPAAHSQEDIPIEDAKPGYSESEAIRGKTPYDRIEHERWQFIGQHLNAKGLELAIDTMTFPMAEHVFYSYLMEVIDLCLHGQS
jgi:hypothetical protein